MTNVLLIIIEVMILVRIIVQVKQGNMNFDCYCTSSEVENCVRVVSRDYYHIKEMIEMMAQDRWELVGAHLTKNKSEILFFSRVKSKTFYENNQ